MKLRNIILSSVFVIVASFLFLYIRPVDHPIVRMVNEKITQTLQTFQGKNASSVFLCDPAKAARYTAYRTSDKIVIDGFLNETSWQKAPRSPRFTDIITGKPTKEDTYAAVLWDDQYLYVAFWVQEPNVSATFTEDNAPVWQENDVEVFIDGGDSYYEFEINPLNTLYQVYFIWEEAYERGGFSKNPVFSRSHPELKPFNGVNFTTHPRGPRLGAWGSRMPSSA